MSVIINNKTTISNGKLILNYQSQNIGPILDGIVFYVDISLPSCYTIGSTTINDISGNGYSGTLYNGVPYDSNNGGSLSFDGTNDYCLTNYTQPAYNPSLNFTWDVWCYPKSIGFQPMVGNRGSYMLPTNFIKLMQEGFQYYPVSTPYISIANGIPINTWSNICIVKDGVTIKYYLNNVLILTSSLATGTFNPLPFYIGGDQSANEYSNSKIASVRIYNRSLSPSEISFNYNLLKSRFGL